jgi:uncharacterized protein (DUF488 family)
MMPTIYTIGHSTRSFEAFASLLLDAQIERLVDVRQFAGSRRYPHFSAAALAESLADLRIDYENDRALGGRRKPQGDSPNAFWRNVHFRSFADYMATDEFDTALERLMHTARQRRVCLMCAEAVPWRCHRWLISDALVIHGFDVEHLIERGQTRPHVLNEGARVDLAGHLVYPGGE